MKKILFVSFNDVSNPMSGGEHCSAMNYQALSEFGSVTFFRVRRKSKLKSLFSLFGLYFPPLLNSDFNAIKTLTDKEKFDYIFFDSSLFGKVIEKLKGKSFAKIIVFFHNVEIDYVKVRFGKKIQGYPYLLLAKFNEKKALYLADYSISLSNRDAQRLEYSYGRTSDFIFPLVLKDRFSEIQVIDESIRTSTKKVGLFVGSYIKPNIEGIKWFINNVLPHLDIKLWIVGKGFELMRNEFSNSKIEIIGTVDSVDSYYRESDFVVSPLFSGAGMKVKITEALMYGKFIFGTTEAFMGFDIDINLIGGLCNNEDEFISKINSFILSDVKINDFSREFFISNYSTQALLGNYKCIIE